MADKAEPEIAYMKNTILFNRPYLWFQRQGERLRLLNLDQANELARNELDIPIPAEAQEGSHVQDRPDPRN